MFMSPSTLSIVPDEDPVPTDVRGVIELFANQLAKVAFPDVDAASLRREVDELRAEAKQVARAKEALEAALATCEKRREQLSRSAARAVAYARIYSEAHPERQPLAIALAGLTNPPAPIVAPKRRGRPPRHGSGTTRADLFDATTLPPALAHADPA
jgi:uncharacterized protein YukE